MIVGSFGVVDCQILRGVVKDSVVAIVEGGFRRDLRVSRVVEASLEP